jgi:hypothetical protein
MPTHQLVASIRAVAPVATVTSVSTFEPSAFARWIRIPSRSDQYSLAPAASTRICFGVYVPPAGTSVVTLLPSRLARMTKPSSADGLPIPVQNMWPAARLIAMPSGPWPAALTSARGTGASAAAVITRPATSR